MSNFDNAEINIDLKLLDGMEIANKMGKFQAKEKPPEGG
jgi:hypothetical protein